MKAQNHEDQVLIDKFSETGDQVLLARLYHRYEHLIYGVCLKYTQDPEWSKDLKAQIYEKLVNKAKGLKVIQFKNWLHTLCKNHCIDAIRKKNRKASTLNKFREFQIHQEDHVYFSAETRHIIEEDKEALINMLNEAEEQLSQNQKLCVDLFFTKRLSYLEIGQETGMNLGEIKSHLQNGRRKMRAYIFGHYKKLD